MNAILISATQTNNERDASNSCRFARFHDTIKDSRFKAKLPLELCQVWVCRPGWLFPRSPLPLHITSYLHLSLLAAVLHRHTADHVSDSAYLASILKCEHNNLLFHWSRAFFFLCGVRSSCFTSPAELLFLIPTKHSFSASHATLNTHVCPSSWRHSQL